MGKKSPFHAFEAASLKELWRGALRLIERAAPKAEEIVDPVDATPECREAFAKAAAGLDVTTFMRIVTQGLPPLFSQRVTQQTDNAYKVNIEGKNFQDEYTFNFMARAIYPGYMQNELRDRDTGRRMFAMRLLAGLNLNFETVEVSAELAMGAYIWARAGVAPKESEKEMLGENIRDRLSKIRKRLDDDTIAKVERLIKFENYTDLAELANLPLRMDNLRKPFDACRIEEDHKYAFSYYKAFGYLKDDSMTLGQYLMLGQKYQGIVALNNDEQMTCLEAYTRVPIRKLARRPVHQKLAA